MDKELPKLLVVVNSGLTSQLAEYALKVATRLDLEIIVLFTGESQATENAEEDHDNLKRFEAFVEKEAAAFFSRAWKSSIRVTTIVDVDNRALAIERLRTEEPEIRFILSETSTDTQSTEFNSPQPRLTVIRPL